METRSWLKATIIILVLAAVAGNVLFFAKMAVVANDDMARFAIGAALVCNLLALALLAWLRHLEWIGTAAWKDDLEVMKKRLEELEAKAGNAQAGKEEGKSDERYRYQMLLQLAEKLKTKTTKGNKDQSEITEEVPENVRKEILSLMERFITTK